LVAIPFTYRSCKISTGRLDPQHQELLEEHQDKQAESYFPISSFSRSNTSGVVNIYSDGMADATTLAVEEVEAKPWRLRSTSSIRSPEVLEQLD